MSTAAGAHSNMNRMWIRALIVWLLIAVIETIHGVLRQVLLVPLTGDFAARQIGVFTGSILIVLTACATSRWIGARSLKQQVAIGALWAAVMVIFEVSLGLALGYSAQRILEDYNLLKGGLMPVGLLVLLLSPLLASKILSAWRQRSGRRSDRAP